MRLQESRILADDVHDVARNHSLVVLASFCLGQPEQILDHRHQEALLGLFVHGARDGADGPTEGVAVRPRPFRPIHLFAELLRHDIFGVDNVQMREVHQALPGRLVQLNRIALLDEFPHDLTLVVLDDENLFGSNHLLDHDSSKVGEDVSILVLAKRVIFEHTWVRRAAVLEAADAQVDQGMNLGHWQLLHFLVQFLYKLGPVLETDLKELPVVNLADADQVIMAV